MPTDWFTGFREIAERIIAFLPTLVGAAVLVLGGWLLGRVLSWLTRRAVKALLDKLARQPTFGSALESSGAGEQAPRVIAGFVFWVILVFFVAAAMETLGLPVVTASLSRAAYYLPNVLAALVVVFAGLIVGKIVGNAVSRAAMRTGIAFSLAIGATVRGTVILVAIVVALEQLEIQADVLVVMVAVVAGAGLAGAGLAFGLGARTAVSNIIASHYVSQAYHVGQTVRIGDVEGKIVQTSPTAVFMATSEGRLMVPANRFSEMTSVLVTETSA
jgi:small-conductance mechanosensitive channel